ncbi:hypothetical protein ABC766_27175 [Methylobacterium fujisawaense]|uniref:hypothetical protein n=1 Tax=Methylobacterium fujisawaense TaxID=107400 RepID=UPI000DB7B6EF
MSQEDDQRLQHILKQSEMRRQAEAQKADFARQHAEAEAKQRETAKPQIEHLIGAFKSTAAIVSGELGAAAVAIEVEAERLNDGGVMLRVRAKPQDRGLRPEQIEMGITDKGYVSGAGFFTGRNDRNSLVDEFDPAMIRSGYLRLAERTLHIRPLR